MLTTIKVHRQDAELLKKIKEKTGFTSNSTIIKLVVDCLLFFFSYIVQKTIIFRKKSTR